MGCVSEREGRKDGQKADDPQGQLSEAELRAAIDKVY